MTTLKDPRQAIKELDQTSSANRCMYVESIVFCQTVQEVLIRIGFCLDTLDIVYRMRKRKYSVCLHTRVNLMVHVRSLPSASHHLSHTHVCGFRISMVCASSIPCHLFYARQSHYIFT